jgi:hypothetical protein
MHRDPLSPPYEPPLRSALRLLLLGLAGCLAVVAAVLVAVGLGRDEMFIFIALALLLWPMIVSRIRAPATFSRGDTSSSANSTKMYRDAARGATRKG